MSYERVKFKEFNMSKSYRPGSMGAAEQKQLRLWLVIFSVLFFIAYLLWVIPSGLYSNYYFRNAGVFWKVLGFISIAAHYWFVWKKLRDMQTSAGDKGSPAWLLFGWFGLNLILLSGFNFSLPE